MNNLMEAVRITRELRDKILLVDDDPDVGRLLTVIMSREEGLPPVIVNGTGEAALARLREATEKPLLVLLDINLPGMSGLEVLRRIKEDPRLKDVQIAMLTGATEPEAKEVAEQLGAMAYIEKPLDIESLVETVKKMTKKVE